MLINQELLRTFVVAARARTFGDAALDRRVTKSAVSQQIKTLEAQLGVPLFERAGRNVRLTDQGRALADVVGRELAVIDEALDAFIEDHRGVRGDLRIAAPRAFARTWLRPRVLELLARHPELRVQITFGLPSELEVALVDRRLDFAVLVREPSAPGLTARAVFTETFSAFAAPSYLAKHGTPKTAEELGHHRYIVFDEDMWMHTQWFRARLGARAKQRTHGVGTIACRVASLDEMLGLCEEGVGIAVLPDYFVGESLAKKRVRSVAPASVGRERHARNTIYLAWRTGAIETARHRVARELLLR